MHQSLSANRADVMLDVRVKDLCPGRLLFVLYRIAFRGARKAEKLSRVSCKYSLILPSLLFLNYIFNHSFQGRNISFGKILRPRGHAAYVFLLHVLVYSKFKLAQSSSMYECIGKTKGEIIQISH